MYHILYNPLAGSGQGLDRVQPLKSILKDEELRFTDVREIQDFASFFLALGEGDAVVVSGGDGTLNYFANDVADISLKNPVYFYPTGSGNDFRADVDPAKEKDLIPLNDYIRDLPTVTVNGMTRRFVNGIGYGIDGYCCEVGDELAKKSDKPINYAGIAIKGLLFYYKPTHAKVTVDGKTYEYDRVWLAPSMNGRFYGGGMNVAPAQDRLAQPKTLTSVVWHGTGKIKTLMRFPSIFKGEHVKYTQMISVMTGKEITVEFDRPVALQIDGETVHDVTRYTVRV